VKGKKSKYTVCGNGILKARIDKDDILLNERETTQWEVRSEQTKNNRWVFRFSWLTSKV
jgi:hypothetical protein